jgi:sugar phosphate isomerase/epimerase
MLEEILELGFDHVELGHGIRLSLMEGIQELYNEGAVTFTSLHNFCPLPIEVTHSSPDCYQFSSHRDAERDRAMKLTFQTIDFAERLGASYVVLHLGRIPMQRITNKLTDLTENGRHLSREFVKLKLKAIKTREARAPHYLDRVRQCLERAAEYASSRNIHLGIESRQSYEEIPSESELPDLLAGINSPYVGYWHDFGHVQIKENLTLLNHFEWLSNIRGRLFGCHLHDVEWPAHDHRPPFTGHVNYDKLIPLLPKNCLFVWEMSPRRNAKEIKQAVQKWRQHFGSSAGQE